MNDQVSFPLPFAAQNEQPTGRYVITFRDDALQEGLSLLRQEAGVTNLASAADFPESALDLNQLDTAQGAVFPHLGIAVVNLEEGAVNRVSSSTAEDSCILDIEPEHIFYVLDQGLSLSLEYLEGYRDAINQLYAKVKTPIVEPLELDGILPFSDDAQSTWGLKATKVVTSRYTGRGIKVAVLDTGMDLQHPDFRSRAVVSKSFISTETVQDGHSHGTHCIGTSCGFKDANGRRYGIAYESTIYVGKVLSNAGSGATSGILAGMEWAIANRCEVISMSLGNNITTPSTAYETIGRRALQNGSLIVAAAGNSRPKYTVGQPANSPSIMAVAAVNSNLQLASFSARSGSAIGANVDLAGPGVAVYSSVPVNKGRYAIFNGTSMATPHVAGVAALYAQASRSRGFQLWQLLLSLSRRLPIDARDVGSGLVQAPQ